MKPVPVTLFLLTSFLTACKPEGPAPRMIDSMGIMVPAADNRDVTFTDKRTAYYYVKSHQTSVEWFSGWNIATHRVLQDYTLLVDGDSLKRPEASVTVYPHQLVREWGETAETFRMYDNLRVLEVGIRTPGEEISIIPDGYQLAWSESRDDVAFYNCIESANGLLIGVAPVNAQPLRVEGKRSRPTLTTNAASGGFFLIADSSKARITDLLASMRANRAALVAARESRMENLLATNFFRSNDASLDLSLKWTLLSLDALITRQRGDGIFAGLPWFNDYWGRDLFITLPGATLVTGQYGVARSILMSFANFQNNQEQSPDYGRVPNRLRPDDIIYNTTDGTPRFVIELLNYIHYSGDTTLAWILYPKVKKAMEGPLKYRVDKNGYLTHDDADTWMDAKIADRIPLSPRGNRANDIQALWYGQLRAGAEIARIAGSWEDARAWTQLADQLRSRFQSDFVDESRLLVADRLLSSGKPDYSLRPNQLFTYDLIRPDSLRWKLTRKIWEDLVYPWGIGSLNQSHDNFYPYHTSWQGYRSDYHKDWAYHNGSVWLWNNGIILQRMIEGFQPDPAYALWRNQARLAIEPPGAVGAMPELLDAFPHEGKTQPSLSGTFSQAWSMSEFLRVWYEGFLGIRPDGRKRQVVLMPQMPDSLFSLDYRVGLFDGQLSGSFHRSLEHIRWTWSVDSLSSDLTLIIKFPGFEPVPAVVYTGEKVVVTIEGTKLKLDLIDSTGSSRAERVLFINPAEQAIIDQANRIFAGMTFAQPAPRPRYRGMDGPPVWRE